LTPTAGRAPAGAPLPLQLLAGQRYFSGLLDLGSEKAKHLVSLLKAAGAEVLRELAAQPQRSASTGGSQQLFGMLASPGQQQQQQQQQQAAGSDGGNSAGGAGAGSPGAGLMVLCEKRKAPRQVLEEAQRLCPGCRVVPFDYVVDCVVAFRSLDPAAYEVEAA
jgi:hypothetical protein